MSVKKIIFDVKNPINIIYKTKNDTQILAAAGFEPAHLRYQLTQAGSRDHSGTATDATLLLNAKYEQKCKKKVRLNLYEPENAVSRFFILVFDSKRRVFYLFYLTFVFYRF